MSDKEQLKPNSLRTDDYLRKVLDEATEADRSGDVEQLRRAVRELAMLNGVQREQKYRMVKAAMAGGVPDQMLPEKNYTDMLKLSHKDMDKLLRAMMRMAGLTTAKVQANIANSVIDDVDFVLPPLHETRDKAMAEHLKEAECAPGTH